MAGTKTSGLGSLILPASNDLFPVVDVSDTSMAASGTTKGIAQDKMTVFGIINVRGYGASGSAQTTTGTISSGSATLTLANAKDFVNGQGILVAGAGAASADLVTTISSGAGTTTLTLADNAGTDVTGVLVQHDDTVAIRAAISDAVTAGGGTIVFPDGTYRLNKDFSTNNALLNVAVSSPEGVVRLVGHSGGWLNPAATGSGAILYADRITGSTSNAVIRGASGTTVYLQNLEVRVPANPTIHGVDFNSSRGCVLENVIIDTGAGAVETTEPTHSTTALILPPVDNYDLGTVQNFGAAGFGTGIQFNEHTRFVGAVSVFRCKVGLQGTAANYVAAGTVHLFQCVEGIKTSGASPIDLILQFEEAHASGNWWDVTSGHSIYDPSDNFKGRLTAFGNFTTPTSAANLEIYDGSNKYFLSTVQMPKLRVQPAANAYNSLTVAANDGTPRVQFGTHGAASTYAGFWAGNVTPSDTNYTFLGDGSTETIFNVPTGGTIRFRVNATDAVNITSTVVTMKQYGAGTATFDASGNISSSSDERLKKIQGIFAAGLAAIKGLEPILYKWNDKSGMETETVYPGLSAQNVQACIPEAVGVNAEGYLTLIDRGVLAALVNAVKELSARVEALETK